VIVEVSDVAESTVYVASDDRADLLTAGRVVRSELGEHDPPSTLVGVTVLGYDDQLVEVRSSPVANAHDLRAKGANRSSVGRAPLQAIGNRMVACGISVR
jgi:hypothetical protein